MSRVSRVPYHQNVYDLLGIEPGERPQAARAITKHEAKHGPLPASVREWYLHAHALRDATPMLPLTDFLKGIGSVSESGDRWAHVMMNEYSLGGYLINLNGAGGSDPPVWTDNEGAEDASEWECAEDRFSDFAWMFVVDSAQLAVARGGPGHLWLVARDEPFQPPVIDYLTDQFGEPERAARPGDVTTYTFRPSGGTIRITADAPTLSGGLSAWWVRADAADRLTEFTRLLLPWGTLRDTLRTETTPAEDVLQRVRGV